MKKTFAVLLVVLVFIFQITQSNAWYKIFTDNCEKLGGLEPGSYSPGAYITRGEVATLVNKLRIAYHIQIQSNKINNFKDIKEINGSKNKSDILELSRGSVINGYSDGTFGTKKLITRAEFAKIITYFLDMPNEYAPSDVLFCDTPKNEWYYKYVAFVHSKKIIDGYTEGKTVKFKPTNNITFAEAAKIAYKSICETRSTSVTTVTPSVTPSTFVTNPAPSIPLSQGTSDTPIVFSNTDLGNAIKLCLNKDISSVITKSDAENVINLDLSSSNISDLTDLRYFKNLTILNLSENKVSDLSELAYLENIADLDLSKNKISNLSALSSLKKLDILTLDSNEISDLSHLNSLENLTSFSVAMNNISDISSLSKNVNLRYLNISRNQCSDISKLSVFTKLEEIYVSFNDIKDISVLASLKKLKILKIDYNKIEDISPLSDLPLSSVYLENNPIIDYTPVQKMNLYFTDCPRKSN